MGRLISLGLIVGGVVLILLSFIGTSVCSLVTSCAPLFPWNPYLSLGTGIVMVLAGVLSYPKRGERREGVGVETR